MSNVTHKAVAMARELASDLAKRFAPLLVNEGYDTDGNPVLTISDGSVATGERTVLIRLVGEVNTAAKDILGNTAIHYTPHKAQIVTEADDGAGNGRIGGFLNHQDILHLICELARRAPAIEWYESDTTDVPAVAEIVAGNLKATFRNLYWNILSQS